MITIAVELEILRLLAQGESNRSIAQQTGAGRTTIDAVEAAGGLRPRPNGKPGTTKKPKLVHTYLCGGCNRVVYWEPCVICTTREWVAQKQGLTSTGLSID